MHHRQTDLGRHDAGVDVGEGRTLHSQTVNWHEISNTLSIPANRFAPLNTRGLLTPYRGKGLCCLQ